MSALFRVLVNALCWGVELPTDHCCFQNPPGHIFQACWGLPVQRTAICAIRVVVVIRQLQLHPPVRLGLDVCFELVVHVVVPRWLSNRAIHPQDLWARCDARLELFFVGLEGELNELHARYRGVRSPFRLALGRGTLACTARGCTARGWCFFGPPHSRRALAAA